MAKKKTQQTQKTQTQPEMPRPNLQRAFRFKDLPPWTGIKRTQLQNLIKSGDFPQGVMISERTRTRVWFESALQKWQAGREAAR